MKFIYVTFVCMKIAIVCYTVAVMTKSIMTMTRISFSNAVNSDGRKVGMVGEAELLVVVIILTINRNDQRLSFKLGLLIFSVKDQITFWNILSDFQNLQETPKVSRK